MDIIFLRGLHIETIIGIYDWERVRARTIELDLEMAIDNRRAARSDAIEDALDYARVTERIVSFVEGSSYFLVETLAEKVCEMIRNEFKVPWVRLTVHKRGAVADVDDLGIVIERGERSTNASGLCESWQ